MTKGYYGKTQKVVHSVMTEVSEGLRQFDQMMGVEDSKSGRTAQVQTKQGVGQFKKQKSRVIESVKKQSSNSEKSHSEAKQACV